MRIWLDKIYGFIKIHDGIRYLVLFDYGWCSKICDRIKYLISEKSDITDSINHNFARVRIHSYNSLPIEKISTFHYFEKTKKYLKNFLKILTFHN